MIWKLIREIVALHNHSGVEISNLKLQKVLYLILEKGIKEEDTVLFDAKLEAWTYGPVFPEIYTEFMRFGGGNIPLAFVDAKLIDTDVTELPIPQYAEQEIKRTLMENVWMLVAETHKEGGVWYNATDKGQNPNYQPITAECIRTVFNGMG